MLVYTGGYEKKGSNKFFVAGKKYLVLHISLQHACLNAWHFNWKAQIVHPYLEFLKGILQETNILCPEGIQSYSQIVIGVSHHLLSISFRWHDHSQKVIGSLGVDASPSSWRCTLLQHFALAEMQIVHFQLGKKIPMIQMVDSPLPMWHQYVGCTPSLVGVWFSGSWTLKTWPGIWGCHKMLEEILYHLGCIQAG